MRLLKSSNKRENILHTWQRIQITDFPYKLCKPNRIQCFWNRKKHCDHWIILLIKVTEKGKTTKTLLLTIAGRNNHQHNYTTVWDALGNSSRRERLKWTDNYSTNVNQREQGICAGVKGPIVSLCSSSNWVRQKNNNKKRGIAYRNKYMPIIQRERNWFVTQFLSCYWNKYTHIYSPQQK